MSEEKSQKVFRRMPVIISIVDSITSVGAALSACAIVVMAFIIAYETFGRAIKHPTIWSYEVAGYIVVFITYFSVAYIQKNRGHVSVEFFVNFLSPRFATYLQVFNSLLGFVFCSIAVYFGFSRVVTSLNLAREYTGPLHTPMWIVQILMPIGMALLGLRYLLTIYEDMSNHTKGGQ